MGHSPSWKANSYSDAQDIPRTLRNPKVHYHIHNSQSIVPIPRQINPVYSLPSDVFKIHFNIILPYKPRYSKCPLSFRFPHQNPVCTSHFPPPRDHLILLGLFTRTFGEKYNLRGSSRLLSTTHLMSPFSGRACVNLARVCRETFLHMFNPPKGHLHLNLPVRLDKWSSVHSGPWI